MIQPAVTVSLVPEARGGPFVFWDDIAAACRTAAGLGFPAVEIFAPSPAVLESTEVRNALGDHSLRLAAAGSGAGWLRHQWHLLHVDPDVRARALGFLGEMIQAAASLGAPVILGSMQGRVAPPVTREQALDFLAQALETLSPQAERLGQPLLYEPLNRYETNVFNRMGDARQFLEDRKLDGVRILADLYHMNIEEVDPPAALESLGSRLGHVHFVDSNRQAPGRGHVPWDRVAAALRRMGYNGYVSAEAVPIPDSETAARATIDTFRKHFLPTS